MDSANRLIACAAIFSLVWPLPRQSTQAAPAQAILPSTSANTVKDIYAGSVLISGLLPNGYEAGLPAQPDESIQLTNISSSTIVLDAHWSLRDQQEHALTFPGVTLTAGARFWIANYGVAFTRQFGLAPNLTYAQMSGSALTFADAGGSLRLIHTTDPISQPTTYPLIDTANADMTTKGWTAGDDKPRASMERIDTGMLDTRANWMTATATSPEVLDCKGTPIIGTPRALNSVANLPGRGVTLSVVINEVAWSGTEANGAHEWVELYNNLPISVSLDGWRLVISSTALYTVKLAGYIGPSGYYLIQHSASTFSLGPQADLTSTNLILSNRGAELMLFGMIPGSTVPAMDTVIDTLVYGNAAPRDGWNGSALQPYTVVPAMPPDGLVLTRKLDAATGLPMPDTDTAEDWMNEWGNMVSARQGTYPGWAFETFAAPVVATSAVTLAVAPDDSYDMLSRALASARHSIDIETYRFDQARLADLLAGLAAQGVTVRLLLDGSPEGGVTDQERWVCQIINTSGSGCWFMYSNNDTWIHARYERLHANFAIIDGARLAIGSEDFSRDTLPDDDKRDGTAGHRGLVALVDAPALVTRAQEIFNADISQAHRDISRWCASGCLYGPPTAGTEPVYATGGTGYEARFATPLEVSAPATVELATSPESNLRAGSILTLLSNAGQGDEILLEQLDEPSHWGPVDGTPETDPNPRLAALIGAAARGARVRILLDSYADDPPSALSNAATQAYLNGLARANGWDLRAVRGNPTGRGMNNKLIAAQVKGRKYVQIGSWDGNEISTKRSREMTLLIESPAAYDYVGSVFYHDLWASQSIYLPVVLNH
jgi:cardiolipin synthase A/B